MGFIQAHNRKTRKRVENEGVDILCPICGSYAKIVARRETKWLTICTFRVVELSRSLAYPACSNCLNGFSTGFSLCKTCRYLLLSNSIFCGDCESAPEEKNLDVQPGGEQTDRTDRTNRAEQSQHQQTEQTEQTNKSHRK